MEQILIYLAIAFIVGLVIVLGITFDRLNKSKTENINSAERLMCEEWENIKCEKRLSEYEKTNVLQINKINELEDEVEKYGKKLVDYEMKNVVLQGNIDDQTDFISSLNERLQKAEAERDKLQSKLSRKGLGKKGRKKNESFAYDFKTEILKGA